MAETILEKIAKVLAKAERTDNEHEADAFFKHAQLLASRHSIDLARARSTIAKSEKREEPIQRTITVGAKGAMGNARMVSLFLEIARANDLKCNIAHNSTYVVAFGFPSDIEVTEALYANLVHQMVEGANAYLKSGAHKDDAVWCYRTGQFKPVNGRTARLNFYDSFTSRIGGRLSEAKREAEAAAKAADEDRQVELSSGTELVLAEKKAEVDAFYEKRSNARGSWRGGSRSTNSGSQSARNAGWAAGGNARMGSNTSLPAAKKAVRA